MGEGRRNNTPPKKSKNRVNVSNVYVEMLERLDKTGRLQAEYHDFQDDEDQEDSDSDNIDEGEVEGENETEQLDSRTKHKKTMYKKVLALQSRFQKYCECVPVLGFNSSKYDLNLVKAKLCKHLRLAEAESQPFTVKKNNSYLTISTSSLQFLDISHYIAPGYSYSQFLKSYKASEKKGFFCYQYLSNATVLEETQLPVYDAFYSSLKECNVLEQELGAWHTSHNIKLYTQDLGNNRYSGTKKVMDEKCKFLSLYTNEIITSNICTYCEKDDCVCQSKPKSGYWNYVALLELWRNSGMNTMKDFLVHYNLKDVEPFTEAVINLQKFYKENQIDLFKDTISVPGAARQMLFDAKNATFALCDQSNEDLYRKIKQNICGGPSIVFTRSMKVGQNLKSGPETCKKIFGFDANALYPYCLRQDMPCGTFVRRKKGNNFKPEIQNKYLDMFVWMDKCLK